MEERRRGIPNPAEKPGYLEKIQGMSIEAALAIPYVKKQPEEVQQAFTHSLTSIALDLGSKYKGCWNSVRPFDCIEEISEGDDFKKLIDLTTLPSAERAVKNYLLMEQAGASTMEELARKQRETKKREKKENTSAQLRSLKSENHTKQYRQRDIQQRFRG